MAACNREGFFKGFRSYSFKSRIVTRVELEREWHVNKHLYREGSVMIDLRAEAKSVYPNTI
jgi:hypothetical protein